jgi:hypothetical protein
MTPTVAGRVQYLEDPGFFWGVGKWLSHRFLVPTFVGSTPTSPTINVQEAKGEAPDSHGIGVKDLWKLVSEPLPPDCKPAFTPSAVGSIWQRWVDHTLGFSSNAAAKQATLRAGMKRRLEDYNVDAIHCQELSHAQ